MNVTDKNIEAAKEIIISYIEKAGANNPLILHTYCPCKNYCNDFATLCAKNQQN
jgi:hypothetical protein